MRKIGVLITILLMTTFVLLGCSKPDPSFQQTGINESSSDSSSMNLTALGMSATGPGLIMMNGLAECINKSFPGSTVTIVPGNLGTNVTRINMGQADMAMSDNVFVTAGVQGEYPFDAKMQNLALVTVLPPQVFQIIANNNIGVQTFDEIIKNKMKVRISCGLPGGAWPLFLNNYLDEYGLTIDDMTDWGCEVLYQGIDDSAKMLADNRIDVLIAAVFIPTPTIQELSRNKEVVLLDMDPNVMEQMSIKYGYQKHIITSGTYEFLREDKDTLSTHWILIVPMNSSEEEVYKITQAIDKNLDYLKSIHASFGDINNDGLLNSLGLPIHPGTEEYYRNKE